MAFTPFVRKCTISAIVLFLFGASLFGFGQAASAISGKASHTVGCSVKIVGNGHGANVSGPYDSTCDGSPSMNGNGNGNSHKPCAGCVGNADGKNPPGQQPGGSDNNKGYECDRNHGIGRGNPAHSGCTTTTTHVSTTIAQITTTTHAPTTTTTIAPTTTTQAPTTTTAAPPTTTAALGTTTTTQGAAVLGIVITPSTTQPAQVLGEVLSPATTSTTTAATVNNNLAHTGANIVPMAWIAFSLLALGLLTLVIGHLLRTAHTEV